MEVLLCNIVDPPFKTPGFVQGDCLRRALSLRLFGSSLHCVPFGMTIVGGALRGRGNWALRAQFPLLTPKKLTVSSRTPVRDLPSKNNMSLVQPEQPNNKTEPP